MSEPKPTYTVRGAPRGSGDIVQRKADILDFIKSYKASNDGNSPNLREIGSCIGVQSTSTIRYYLAQLEEDGLIVVDKRLARHISVTGGMWVCR